MDRKGQHVNNLVLKPEIYLSDASAPVFASNF